MHRHTSLCVPIVSLLMTLPLGAAPLPRPDGESLLRAARAARRAGDYDRATAHLKECERRGEVTMAHQMEALLSRVQQGEADATQQALKALPVARGKDLALIAEALARGYLEEGLVDEAEEILDQWQERRQYDAELAFCRGLARQWRSAVGPYNVYGKSSSEEHGFGMGLRVLNPARPLVDDGTRTAWIALAANSYRLAIEEDPCHDEARLRLATVLLDLERPRDALNHLERVARRPENDSRVLLQLGRCRSLLGEDEAARKVLGALLVRQPKSAAVLRERGQVELRAGKDAKAEEWLSKAYALGLKDRWTLEALKECRTRLGKTEAADQLSGELASLKHIEWQVEGRLKQLFDPKYADKEALLRAEIGRLHQELGRGPAALYWGRSALRVDPDCVSAHSVLSKQYEVDGRKELAERHRKAAAAK